MMRVTCSVAGAARLAAAPSHAGEVCAFIATLSVVVNVDLDAAATPFGNLGVGVASSTAALLGSFVYDVCHMFCGGSLFCYSAAWCG